MKKMKKLLALLLVLVMALSLVACGGGGDAGEEKPDDTQTEQPEENKGGEENSAGGETEDPAPVEKAPSTNPEDMYLEGRYVYKYTAEGHGDYVQYFHFYEEDPVLGAVFYAGFMNNKMNFTGTYKVEKVDTPYKVFVDRAAATSDEDSPERFAEGTAPYAIKFFDWDGNELGQVAYDGENIYNAMGKDADGNMTGEKIYGQGAAPLVYHHDLEVENGPNASTYAGELGVPYVSLVATEDPTSTLEIYHNKTYADLVGAMVEGTYTVAAVDGGLEFTLTPNDSLDTGAKLVLSADKATATYTPDGGDPIAMENAVKAGPAVTLYFEGKSPTKHSVEANLLLNVYDDGTCAVIANVAGNEMEIDKGTYTVEGGYKYTFTFEKAGEVKSATEDASLVVDYAQAGTALGDLSAHMALHKD